MQIDELLHIAGDLSLKSFAWGPGVVETLNNLFAEAKRITPEITGNQALDILKALPPPALTGILAIRLNTATGRPMGEEPPDDKGDSAKTDPPSKKKSIVPLILAGATTLIALIITLVITASAAKTGAAPDEGLVKLVLSTMVEILKLFMPPAPATPTAFLQLL